MSSLAIFIAFTIDDNIIAQTIWEKEHLLMLPFIAIVTMLSLFFLFSFAKKTAVNNFIFGVIFFIMPLILLLCMVYFYPQLIKNIGLYILGLALTLSNFYLFSKFVTFSKQGE